MEKVYASNDIKVFWYPERCSHSARCLNGLPSVFNLNQRPWVNITAAPALDIIKTIDTCPSGALKYDLPAGSSVPPEAAKGPGWLGNQKTDPVLRIKMAKDGPLLLEGVFELVNAEGGIIERGSRAALCRCGLSSKKPYCDGTHFRQSWRE